ncbi:hypothetical protein BY996DRAFT_6409546 [Phakopsora pachyrhizi]|uniref:Expressed protein n=1 Tax=Phakopsora pachyrhizi TaxID=170000 RepID=A0AAV0AM64_PHAPC|nr:hypothetical protein BY996DRAFT_6409546 [Phakopsora pachyrhizi]CAH7669901.1 expressed protein [Phakopsora pachyrhizi]
MEPPRYYSSSQHQQLQQLQQLPTSSSNNLSLNNLNQPFLINITPSNDLISFINPHLPISSADPSSTWLSSSQPLTVEGELQIKPSSVSVQSICSISIQIVGRESTQVDSIDLLDQCQLLWHQTATSQSHQPTSCFNNQSPDSTQAPPGVLPFRFTLDNDLPSCIHLSNHHGINYQLVATILYHQNNQQSSRTASATQSVPIHIFRFTDRSQSVLSNQSIVQPQPRTDQQPQRPLSLSPTDIDICSPTPIRISLSQTLIRRSEPLELRIRIPPPSNQLLKEKRLRLRSVRAELRRHIRIKSQPKPPSAHPHLSDNHEDDGPSRTNDAPPYESLDHHSSNHPQQPDSQPSQTIDLYHHHHHSQQQHGPDQEQNLITRVLAISGKSCRFSSTRPIFLRLTLRSCLAAPSNQSSSFSSTSLLPRNTRATRPSSPTSSSSSPSSSSLSSPLGLNQPFTYRLEPELIKTDLSCETVSQSSVLHDIYFTVSVTVKITGGCGESQDIVVEREIGVLPDWPPLQNSEQPLTISASAAGKAREAAEEAQGQAKNESEADWAGPAPNYFETNEHHTPIYNQASTSNVEQDGLGFNSLASSILEINQSILDDGEDDDEEEEEGEEEEEYDGYESFSSLAGRDGPAPPTIDEDESPPPAPDTPPEGIQIQSIFQHNLTSDSILITNPNHFVSTGPTTIIGGQQLSLIDSNDGNGSCIILPMIGEIQGTRRVMHRGTLEERVQERDEGESRSIEVTGGRNDDGLRLIRGENSSTEGFEVQMGSGRPPPAYGAGWEADHLMISHPNPHRNYSIQVDHSRVEDNGANNGLNNDLSTIISNRARPEDFATDDSKNHPQPVCSSETSNIRRTGTINGAANNSREGSAVNGRADDKDGTFEGIVEEHDGSNLVAGTSRCDEVFLSSSVSSSSSLAINNSPPPYFC